MSSKCLFSKIHEAIENRDYDTVSMLQIEINKAMNKLRKCYNRYTKNLLEIEE